MNPDLSSSLEPAENTWHEVTDPAAVHALLDRRTQRYLRPYLGRERSVGEVAAELNEGIDTVLYRTRRLERLGLLEVARIEARAGRPVKRYRSVANGFIVPPHAAPPGGAEAMLALLEEELQARYRHGLARILESDRGVGLRMFRTRDDRVRGELTPYPEGLAGDLSDDAPAVINTTMLVRLSREEAKAFQRELAALYERYGRRTERGRTYVARLNLAPVNWPDGEHR